MTTDTLTRLTPRENECFEAMDRVLDRMLGETDWRATRRAFLAERAPYTAAYHVSEFDDLKDYTDAERAAALRELRARVG